MFAVILIHIIVFLMQILYAFFKIKRTKKKILIASRQGNKLSENMQLLADALKKEYPEYEIKIISFKGKNSFAGMVQSLKYIILTMYHLADSRLCILDGYNMPVSVLKHKKALKVVQMWHALMAVKKFGYQILDKPNGYKTQVAKALRMHEQYDLVIAGGEGSRKHFAEAFNMPLEKILPLGAPIVDTLLQEPDSTIIKTYPQILEKETILYAPTFRKNRQLDINSLIKAFDFDRYNLVIKLHPLDKQLLKDNRIIIDKKFSTEEIMKVCDIVVTDYSALSLSAAIMNKKLFFYIPDAVEYKTNQGLNIDIESQFNEYCFTDVNNLISSINNKYYRKKQVKDFANYYMNVSEDNCTKMIVQSLSVFVKVV
ncbi:MAG: CDP-glycerol glycerophosphotransferase family protein [Spirochaetales bacterium]|nr:CDP-glycerol glycerophosphotransferase family protein [Spirochaetales bacterium]